MKTIETKNLDIIENKLKEMKYEEIPEPFIQLVNEKFDTYSYLKSLIELTKDL